MGKQAEESRIILYGRRDSTTNLAKMCLEGKRLKYVYKDGTRKRYENINILPTLVYADRYGNELARASSIQGIIELVNHIRLTYDTPDV